MFSFFFDVILMLISYVFFFALKRTEVLRWVIVSSLSVNMEKLNLYSTGGLLQDVLLDPRTSSLISQCKRFNINSRLMRRYVCDRLTRLSYNCPRCHSFITV